MTMAAKPVSMSAIGPCWKSAEEYGSTATYASSLALSAASNAVAKLNPRPSTTPWPACFSAVAAASTASRSTPWAAATNAGTSRELAAPLVVLRDRRRQHRQRGQLRGVGLRRRDAPLLPRPQHDRVVGDRRERRPGHVGDRQRRAALPPSLLDHRDEIGRLARLRDADDERAGHDGRRLVARERATAWPASRSAGCARRTGTARSARRCRTTRARRSPRDGCRGRGSVAAIASTSGAPSVEQPLEHGRLLGDLGEQH